MKPNSLQGMGVIRYYIQVSKHLFMGLWPTRTLCKVW
jgi:hypothetical protein